MMALAQACGEQARKELIDVLDSPEMRGKKVLVLDPNLSGPLALIAQPSMLKEHGVVQLHHLSSEPIITDVKNILYLVRPRLQYMDMIAQHLQHNAQTDAAKHSALYFVPRRTMVCEKVLDVHAVCWMDLFVPHTQHSGVCMYKILEERGVLGDVTIGEYELEFIPFDEDVLSLEMDMSFKECAASWGIIPRVMGKGAGANAVADIMARMRREVLLESTKGRTAPPEFDTMVLIDREVDMLTPMCTQLTYEGLIDEILRINNGTVEMEQKVQDPAGAASSSTTKKVKIPLNSSDKLFREIRDKNFSVVGAVLRERATTIRSDYKGLSPEVAEIKQFVKKLNALPEIERHIGIAEQLTVATRAPAFLSRINMEQAMVEGRNFDANSEYVEEMVCKQEPLLAVLRLLCLLSLTSNGLPRKHFDAFRRELLHAYGFDKLFTVTNLEKAGLLRKQDGKGAYALIKRAMKLVVDDHDDSAATDIAFTYSGYAPLSIRLVQQAITGGWKPIEDVLKNLPGPHFDAMVGEDDHAASTSLASQQQPAASSRRSRVLVVFVGGVTYAEVSALRWWSMQESVSHDFVVATTKLVSGMSLLNTLVEDYGRT
eukprot:jgi/Chlat1/3940/Chrsp26S04033